MKVQLTKLAHARSGDKGDTANVGLIALSDDLYPILVREVTAERVKQHFKGICHGKVERFELPNLGALNFLLHESLGGGGTLSLLTTVAEVTRACNAGGGCGSCHQLIQEILEANDLPR